MKLKLFGTICLLLIVGGLLAINNDRELSARNNPVLTPPCEEPLTYRIGNIDSRFNISRKELANIMTDVEALWDTAMNRDLVEYSQNGKVAIHLIYSEEQQRTENEKTLSQRIESQKQRITVLEKEYNRLSEQYEDKSNEFKESLSKYNAMVKSYNAKFNKYRQEGGISKSQKQKLDTLKRKINRLKSKTQRQRRNMESLRKRTNAKSQKLNGLVEEHKHLVAKYNRQFADSIKFDQGRYIEQGSNRRINIFQFANRAELKTVLAHEVGHALGLNHVGNPKSIMHRMMGGQNIFNLALTNEDKKALRKRCTQ